MKIVAITGSMGSGKSEMLIDVIKTLKTCFSEDNILVCGSLSCCRVDGYISSRNGEKHKANLVTSFDEILTLLKANKECKVLLVDEVQLLEAPLPSIIELVNYCTNANISIYFSGLEINCLGEPFPIMGIIFCYADEIVKLKGTCSICGKENSSNRAIRYMDGKIDRDKLVVKPDTNQITIDADENRKQELMNAKTIEYKSVCAECFLKEMGKFHEDAMSKI